MLWNLKIYWILFIPIHSGGFHRTHLFGLQKSPVQHSPPNIYRICMLYVSWKWTSPAQSGRVQSSPVRHSPATYIRYVRCMFLESGLVRRSPLDTSLDSRRVQSDTAVRRIPLDTPLWTPLPFLTPEESSPAQSTGVHRTDHVTICDPSGQLSLRWSPAESGGQSMWRFVTHLDSG